MQKIRYAGAQIPCSEHLDQNIKSIKDAISWAAENEVDYLLTPEGSLSGYFPGFETLNGRSIQDLVDAEKQVVEYAAHMGVGLCLGTMWCEPDDIYPEGYRRENQIRFYTKDGTFLDSTNKHYVLPEYDGTVVSDDITIVYMPERVKAAGLICNDFWGGSLEGGNLPIHVADRLGVHLIFHATNGFRGENPNYDEITNVWHEGNLRMVSYSTGIPIITVDNCYMMNGKPYDGPTSSQSGILLNGLWKVKAPRSGTQYFYYDFNLLKLQNHMLRQDPDLVITGK
jgi:predicted amidohydrolase